MEFLSTTALANELEMQPADLFAEFKRLGWIDKINNKWILTDLGKKQGGKMKSNPQYGDYIVWPENIMFQEEKNAKSGQLINATDIGDEFGISNRKLNLVLSELGWITKDVAGWKLTNLGKTIGGKQREHDVSGNTFVLWPKEILQNKNLLEVLRPATKPVANINQQTNNQTSTETKTADVEDFRTKFPCPYRTQDGHFVRSRAEVMIDDALYLYNLAHSYERKVPVPETLYSDFYLREQNVYIEYWGLENDPSYQNRKAEKLAIYKKYDLKLIEITDEELKNLDDHLPKKLLKYNIKVY